MQISVNGEWLDMTGGDIAFSWSNMRFSDVFADAYSTDFDLPMTARNMRLLGVWSVLSRIGEPFGDMIPCGVMMRGKSADGLLSVNGVKDSTISVTVYLVVIPQALRDANTRMIVDTSETIVDFTDRTLELPSISSPPTTNYTFYQSAAHIVRPNVKLDYIFQQIASLTGVVLPTVSETLRVIGTRQVVCPQVERQLIMWSVLPSTGLSITQHGQHISNEVDTDANTITMNRDAEVAMRLYWSTTMTMAGAYARLQVSTNGGLNWTNVQDFDVTAQTSGSVTVQMQAGTVWRFQFAGWGGAFAAVCIYSDYTITEDDYDTALAFDSSATYEVPDWVDEDISYVYYGVMANIPATSIRDLLSSLAWMQGKRIVVEPYGIALDEPDVTEEIDAEIVSVAFDSGLLGQEIKIESAGGETLASMRLNNSKLEASRTVHKSVFALLGSVGAYGMVYLDLYSESEEKWTAIDYSGIALAVRAQNISGVVYLKPVTGWSFLGIDDITRVCEVQGVTKEDVSGYDYVIVDGHRYMLTDGTIEEETGLTTFNALLI